MLDIYMFCRKHVTDVCFYHLPQIARLKHVISVERAAFDETKKHISKISAENDILREQLATENKSKPPEERFAPCADQDTLDRVLVQVR